MTLDEMVLHVLRLYQPVTMSKLYARLSLITDRSIFDVSRTVSKLTGDGVVLQDDKFKYSLKEPVTLVVMITVKVGNVEITDTRPMLATEPDDNEENAARLADQMVRAAIRRHYGQNPKSL